MLRFAGSQVVAEYVTETVKQWFQSLPNLLGSFRCLKQGKKDEKNVVKLRDNQLKGVLIELIQIFFHYRRFFCFREMMCL